MVDYDPGNGGPTVHAIGNKGYTTPGRVKNRRDISTGTGSASLTFGSLKRNWPGEVYASLRNSLTSWRVNSYNRCSRLCRSCPRRLFLSAAVDNRGRRESCRLSTN